jgi:membrane protein required for colicin V production
MGIDIAIAIVVFIAFIKGFTEGIIRSFFSISAYIVGFFAAMHFSFVVSDYLHTHFNLPPQWLPIISFVLMFLMVMILVQLVGNLIEKIAGIALPTVFNKLAGGLFWAVFGCILMSLFIQFLDSADLFKDSLKQSSATMPYVEKVNTIFRNRIGELLPVVKNLYQQIDNYFEALANQIKV